MNILAAEAHNPLIPPLGEIIIGLIAFAIVFFVFAKFVAPRFEQVFRARREAIEGGIERAETMQAEAKAALEQYRAQLAEARNEAAQIRDQARAEGQQILEELRDPGAGGVGADRRPRRGAAGQPRGSRSSTSCAARSARSPSTSPAGWSGSPSPTTPAAAARSTGSSPSSTAWPRRPTGAGGARAPGSTR